jgi:hypothetical protein
MDSNRFVRIKLPEAPRPEKKTDSKVMETALSLVPPLLRRQPRAGSKRRRSGRAPTLPPQLEAVMIVKKTLRFLASGAFSANITGQMLAGACGGCCTVTNSVVTCWASSARVHKITVWPSVSLTAPSPEIIWYSPLTVNERDESKMRTLPSGVTVDRAVVSSPPSGTLAGGWINLVTLGTTALFKMIGIPASSVIDVQVTFTLSNNILGQDLGVVTGVLKTFYYLPLDGPSSNILRAIGLPTTA